MRPGYGCVFYRGVFRTVGQLAGAGAGFGSRIACLATASLSSSWRMSAKIAGTPIRPIAPSTRNARWRLTLPTAAR